MGWPRPPTAICCCSAARPTRRCPTPFTISPTGDPQPEYPLQLQFLLDGQPALECLGLDLSRHKDGMQATFYWRALQPLPAELRLYPFYFDDATGRILEDTSLRPMIATVWYPPQDWKPGEVIRTSMLPWQVGPAFGVGLGVMQGLDWSAVGQRLPIRVESSDPVVRLFDGDTWARLIGVENGQVVEELRSFDLPLPQNPLGADLRPIRLLGFDLSRQRTAIDLTLYWQANERVRTGYTVFVQLLDGRPGAAQADAVPRSWPYPPLRLPGSVPIRSPAGRLCWPASPTTSSPGCTIRPRRNGCRWPGRRLIT